MNSHTKPRELTLQTSLLSGFCDHGGAAAMPHGYRGLAAQFRGLGVHIPTLIQARHLIYPHDSLQLRREKCGKGNSDAGLLAASLPKKMEGKSLL